MKLMAGMLNGTTQNSWTMEYLRILAYGEKSIYLLHQNCITTALLLLQTIRKLNAMHVNRNLKIPIMST